MFAPEMALSVGTVRFCWVRFDASSARPIEVLLTGEGALLKLDRPGIHDKDTDSTEQEANENMLKRKFRRYL